jgi:DNA-binding MarR family transcriptional regulator
MGTNVIDDERTNALGLFNTARSYWRSAEHLSAAKLAGATHPQAPVTFLYCHSIELYLKAHLRGVGTTVASLKKVGHRVADLAKLAADSGLRLEPEASEILSHVDDADVPIEARYIVTGFKNRPTNEALSIVAEQLDQIVGAALSSSGLPVHEERFTRPEAQRQNELGGDTSRVLVHLFRAKEIEDRDVGAMARAFGFESGILKYHLDRLADAGFADETGLNYLHGHVYWALTPEGRRYVVESKLI